MTLSTGQSSKVLFVFSTAPYANGCGQEGLDALLSAATLEQDISVLFIHDGIFQLKKNQSTSSSQLKQVTKAFQALADFGVEQIYVYQASMMARGLSCEDLMLNAEMLATTAAAELIKNQNRVFTF